MASPEPAVGVTLGRYQLVASLGRGGMADVFLALAQGELGFTKLVVLKCMRVTDQEQAFTSMFFDEVRLAARLSHPNIVNTFDGGDAGGTYFLAMEFLEGQPLHQVYRAWSARQPKPVWKNRSACSNGWMMKRPRLRKAPWKNACAAGKPALLWPQRKPVQRPIRAQVED